jgi:hypothetical protein
MTSKVVLLRCAAAAFLAATLCGCAQYNAYKEQQLAEEAQAEEAQDDAACRADGTPPGSPTYIQCRARIDNARNRDRAAIAATLRK